MARVIEDTGDTHVFHDHHVDSGDSNNSMAFLMGIILLVVLAFLFLYYGLPRFRSASTTPQVNVPSQVDVNVNKK